MSDESKRDKEQEKIEEKTEEQSPFDIADQFFKALPEGTHASMIKGGNDYYVIKPLLVSEYKELQAEMQVENVDVIAKDKEIIKSHILYPKDVSLEISGKFESLKEALLKVSGFGIPYSIYSQPIIDKLSEASADIITKYKDDKTVCIVYIGKIPCVIKPVDVSRYMKYKADLENIQIELQGDDISHSIERFKSNFMIDFELVKEHLIWPVEISELGGYLETLHSLLWDISGFNQNMSIIKEI